MTGPASPPPALPRGFRLAALVCLILSGLSGFSSLKEALELGHLAELRDEASNMARFSKDKDMIVLARLSEIQLAAREPMRESRTLVLGGLSLACAFMFVCAGRLLKPAGLPMERIRRLISGAAIIAALLRTIDGAQSAVIGRSVGTAAINVLGTLPEFQNPETLAQLKAGLPGLAAAFAMGLTALIAGTFALLGQYFRSERVREAIIAHDGENLAEEED